MEVEVVPEEVCREEPREQCDLVPKETCTDIEVRPPGHPDTPLPGAEL